MNREHIWGKIKVCHFLYKWFPSSSSSSSSRKHTWGEIWVKYGLFAPPAPPAPPASVGCRTVSCCSVRVTISIINYFNVWSFSDGLSPRFCCWFCLLCSQFSPSLLKRCTKIWKHTSHRLQVEGDFSPKLTFHSTFEACFVRSESYIQAVMQKRLNYSFKGIFSEDFKVNDCGNWLSFHMIQSKECKGHGNTSDNIIWAVLQPSAVKSFSSGCDPFLKWPQWLWNWLELKK